MPSAVEYSPLEIACMVAGSLLFAVLMALIESDTVMWEDEHQRPGETDGQP